MRIGIYNVTASLHYGGLETYAWEVGEALVQRGHPVEIIAGEGGAARSDRIPMLTFPFRARSRFPDLGTRFCKLMERLSFARAAWRHLASAGYDTIIINKPYDFPTLWWAKRHGLKAKVVYRSGGTEFYAGDRLFAGCVDRWVSSSAYNARQVAGRYRRPVVVIHNGVDAERFRPMSRVPAQRAAWGVPEDALLLMSVGRLVGWKGLQVIVDILPSHESVHYAYVGEGPLGSALEARAQDLGISDRVHALGGRPHLELPRVLSQADIFVQPSVGEEAFGITVVEAMACGLPVLASRNGGMTEIVDDGQNGLLLPPGETTEWSAAVRELAGDDARRREMAEAGRRRAVAQFTWAANAERLEQLILGDSGVPAAGLPGLMKAPGPER
jgi:glycosyltransferase involved in cell wall biosynthesis